MKTITIQIPDDCKVQIIKKENSEKNKLIIRTYQDLIDNKIVLDTYYYIAGDSNIYKGNSYTTCDRGRKMAVSEKIAKSMLAMTMISQLMPYYGGEITDAEWVDATIDKYIISKYNNKIDIDTNCLLYHFLAFHTKQQREEFLKYNEQLVKNYLMIDY